MPLNPKPFLSAGGRVEAGNRLFGALDPSEAFALNNLASIAPDRGNVATRRSARDMEAAVEAEPRLVDAYRASIAAPRFVTAQEAPAAFPACKRQIPLDSLGAFAGGSLWCRDVAPEWRIRDAAPASVAARWRAEGCA